jgi:septum site-determining protein MinD
MTKIISVHSFRGGTGKSNTSANIAAMLVAEGQRVAVVDGDIQSPGIHVLFGQEPPTKALNHYLWGECTITDVTLNITAQVFKNNTPRGTLYFVPSSMKPDEIARVIRKGYDVDRFNDGLRALSDEYNLDVILLDTHPGLNEDTLLSIAISDIMIILMRPDQQDFQGTSVTIEVARKLGVPELYLLVNKTPPALALDDVHKKVEAAYGIPVLGVLHHSDELMTLASESVFVLTYPNSEIAATIKNVVKNILNS